MGEQIISFLLLYNAIQVFTLLGLFLSFKTFISSKLQGIVHAPLHLHCQPFCSLKFHDCASFVSFPAIQKVHPQASVLMSFNTPFWRERLQQWKLSQQKMSCTTRRHETFLNVNDSSPLLEVEGDQLERYEVFDVSYFSYLS